MHTSTDFGLFPPKANSLLPQFSQVSAFPISAFPKNVKERRLA
jgi:hypothetical protein